MMRTHVWVNLYGWMSDQRHDPMIIGEIIRNVNDRREADDPPTWEIVLSLYADPKDIPYVEKALALAAAENLTKMVREP